MRKILSRLKGLWMTSAHTLGQQINTMILIISKKDNAHLVSHVKREEYVEAFPLD